MNARATTLKLSMKKMSLLSHEPQLNFVFFVLKMEFDQKNASRESWSENFVILFPWNLVGIGISFLHFFLCHTSTQIWIQPNNLNQKIVLCTKAKTAYWIENTMRAARRARFCSRKLCTMWTSRKSSLNIMFRFTCRFDWVWNNFHKEIGRRNRFYVLSKTILWGEQWQIWKKRMENGARKLNAQRMCSTTNWKSFIFFNEILTAIGILTRWSWQWQRNDS